MKSCDKVCGKAHPAPEFISIAKALRAGREKRLSWARWLCMQGVETKTGRISVTWETMRQDCFTFNFSASVPDEFGVGFGFGVFFVVLVTLEVSKTLF